MSRLTVRILCENQRPSENIMPVSEAREGIM